MGPGRGADGDRFPLRHHHAAGAVVRVLHFDQRGRGKERMAARLAGRQDLGGRERTPLADFGELHTGVSR